MYFFIFNSFSKFYFFIYENNIVFVLLCGVWYSVWSCFVVRCIYVTVMRSDAEWDSGSVLWADLVFYCDPDGPCVGGL